MDLNRAQIIGRLTQDPEVKQTPSGQSVTSFGIATNRRWKDKNTGEQREEVEFHNIVLWGKLAEIAGNYLKKGRRVFIEGRLQTRSWEDSSGVKKYKTEIVGDNMIMLDGRGGDGDMEGSMAPNMPVVKDEAPLPDEGDAADKKSAPKKQDDISIEDVPF